MNHHAITTILAQAPTLLQELIAEIPRDMLMIRRRPQKWCIHENACHLAEVHPMMIERFKKFKSDNNPVFTPYLPGTDATPDNNLIQLDLQECLARFQKDRQTLITLISTLKDTDWQKQAVHPEYIKFTAEIFLRHIMMHDQLHMYRIEELWLTRDTFL